MHAILGRFRHRAIGLAVVVTLAACSHSGSSGHGSGGGTPPTPPPHVLYVSSGAQILVFAVTSNGDASPLTTIGGAYTGLAGPQGLAVDSSRRLYVANAAPGASSVTVYAKGASGDAAPFRTLAGTATSLNGPSMLALDSASNLYVTNNSLVTGGTDSVNVFLAGANGNATPSQLIEGSATRLATPAGIAVDSNGEIVVANAGTGSATSSITVYAKGANGNATPIREIAGAATKLDQPNGLLVDSNDRIWVCSHSSVLVFPVTANGNVMPAFTLSGSATQMIFTNVGLTFDSTGALDVVNSSGAGSASSILEFTGLTGSLPAGGNLTPARVVTGAATNLIDAFGIASL